MTKLVAATVLVAALAFPHSAEARRANVRFLFDAAPGVTIPIADDGWRQLTSASFKLSLRTGGEIWFSRHFGVAGEIDTDFEPLIEARNNVYLRFRPLLGFRLLFGFGVGAFFIRHAIGADITTGLVDRAGHLGVTEAALAVEPGIGLQFRFARRGVAGFAVDFPLAFFGSPYFATDVQFLGFIGVRI